MMRVFQRFKKREFILLGGLSVAFVFLLLFLLKVELEGNIPKYVSHIGHEGEEQFIYHLQDGQKIKQDFVSPRDFDFATINFSDHDTSITGKTFLTVTEKESGELLEYREISNSDIHYGKSVPFLEKGGRLFCAGAVRPVENDHLRLFPFPHAACRLFRQTGNFLPQYFLPAHLDKPLRTK